MTQPPNQWGQPQQGAPQPQWGQQMAPQQQWLTGPPPPKSTARTVGGWVMILWGALFGLVVLGIIPIYYGIRMVTREGKDKAVWRERENALRRQQGMPPV